MKYSVQLINYIFSLLIILTVLPYILNNYNNYLTIFNFKGLIDNDETEINTLLLNYWKLYDTNITDLIPF